MSDGSLIHPTYKYLAREIRIAGLALSQWSCLVAAGFTAFLLSRVLPFGDTYNISVAVTFAGTPAAVALAAGSGEFHVVDYARALARHHRRAALHLPGDPPQAMPSGYELTADHAAASTSPPLQVDALWDD